jgi:retinoblastoma-like protein 1
MTGDGEATPVTEETAVEKRKEAEVDALYRGLCAELNMDTETSEEAWCSYMATRRKYTLEGDQLHWLACALYVACRRGSLPTVGRQVVMEGNGVSLTRLLRNTKLALIQFFSKARLWADMCNLKTELVDKIDKLERNFAVSNVIFKKYQPIFVDLFKDPSEDPPKPKQSRKQKRPPCSSGEVFDFCWTLFIRVKGHFPAISDDLVNSYHLLLSCVDYIYSCAWTDGRADLLNPVFDCAGEPGQPVCILDKLCTMHDGILTEVKSIREHWLKVGKAYCLPWHRFN